jgi:predicted RNA-binding protein with PUA-like domain
MAGWLLKTEPSEYSYDDLEREGRTVWDGVRNPVALRHLAEIRAGDACLIYHTGTARAVIGVGEAASDAYPDPANPALALVDITPVRRLARPVPLAEIKADPRFARWELTRVPRLSVMPVPEHLWEAVLEMASWSDSRH